MPVFIEVYVIIFALNDFNENCRQILTTVKYAPYSAFKPLFKQTIELHPDVNILYHAYIHIIFISLQFQYKNTIFSCAIDRNFVRFTYIVYNLTLFGTV